MQIARDERPGKLLGIRIENKLVGIEAMALIGLIGAVDAIAVELSWAHLVEMHMPDILRALWHDHTCVFAGSDRIEQAELDLFGMRGEQREVGASAIGRCPERIGRPRRNAHSRLPRRHAVANSIETDRMAAQDSQGPG